MDYFLIPGRHPSLSAAELWAVAGREGLDVRLSSASEVVFLTAKDALPRDLPSWLGGMVKFGEIIGETAEEDLAGHLADSVAETGGRDFGISIYPAGSAARFKNLGLEVKRLLRERGAKSRWVTSREPTLSAVVVRTNGLLGPGVELCLFAGGKRVRFGRTTTVQAFDEFSFRDYGRPRRDIRSGMLPVKLARMLINLSRTPRGGTLLDPFCGSGTIVTEAALLGFREVIGSDLEEKAVADTSENVEWVRRHFDISKTAVKIIRSPAEKIDLALRGIKADGMATEPYLGPPLRGRERPTDIGKIIRELSGLYQNSFASFRNVLAPEALVAAVFPLFLSGGRERPLPVLEELKELGFLPAPLLPPGLDVKTTARGSLIYRRPDQRVLREVFVFIRR